MAKKILYRISMLLLMMILLVFLIIVKGYSQNKGREDLKGQKNIIVKKDNNEIEQRSLQKDKFHLNKQEQSTQNDQLIKNQKQRIAVLDFNANNASLFAAKAVSEVIATEMSKKNVLTIVERSQMKVIFEEQGLQMSGCTDSSCAVQVGKILSAKKVLIGTLSNVSGIYVITSRVVDVETARVEFADTEQCREERDVVAASRILSIKLLNRLTGRNYDIPIRTYHTDEQRNRFSVGLSYTYKYVPGLNIPYLRENFENYESGGHIHMFTIAPGYEILDFLTVGLNFNYAIVSILDLPETEYDLSPGYYDVTSPNPPNRFGFGSGIWGQLSYTKLSGFRPWVSLGFDLMYFVSPKSVLEHSYAGPARYAKYDCTYEDTVTASILFKIGLSVYISRFFEFFVATGADIPILSRLYNITVKETFDYGNNTNPLNEFDGNFPAAFIIQMGFNIRVF